jgi:acyl-CoA dehydrogenase
MLGAQLVHRAGLASPPGVPVVAAPVARRSLPTLLRGAGGVRLDGVVRRIPWARAVDAVVLAAGETAGDEPHLVLVTPDEARVERGANLAGEPRDDLVLESFEVEPERLAPSPVSPTELRLLLALFRLALMAGAQERVLDLTLEHAAARVQFGRPIGRFQAIQQQLAILAGETAAVVAATEAAAAAIGTPEAPLAVAAAKARASESVRRATAIAHQVHGAIGFTREHVLHRFTRRLWAWRDEAGDEREWWDELGSQALATGGDRLWTLLAGL